VKTTATSKGQIVIPSSVRRKLGIKEGTRIHIEVNESANEIILTPITREHIHSLRGKYQRKGLLEELKAEKQREKKL
jgi:AbrB family looped-hinge helix DNA binding protein